MKPKPIDRRDLTEQSYELLKAHILQRHFSPNEKLSVDRLAQQLGVSRTPAKDALNRLAADGLVTIQPRVGSFVTPMTTTDVREIFDVRLLIEHHAVEQIASLPDTTIQHLQHNVEAMADCISGNDYRADRLDTFIELDSDLHRQLVSATGNQRLLTIYDNLNVHLHITRAYYVRKMGNAAHGQQEHQQIADCCQRRDVTGLKTVLKAHIVNVRNIILEIIEANGGII